MLIKEYLKITMTCIVVDTCTECGLEMEKLEYDIHFSIYGYGMFSVGKTVNKALTNDLVEN